MRVWVTGGGGFVAARLAPRLEAAGHDVTATDREVDAADAQAVTAVAASLRPDAVIHLAAQSSVVESQRDPRAAFRVNFGGALHLLAACAREAPAARILLAGSAEEYGGAPSESPPLDEEQPLAPASPYARSKAAADLLGARAAARGQDVVRVRAFPHTGPGQPPRFAAPSFARQLAEIEAGLREPRLLVGNLESVRDLLDVDDVVSAYLALLDPAVPADAYNVASGRGVALRVVLDLLLAASRVQPVVERDPARFRPTDRLVGDASRLRRATGWEPRVPLDDTLRRLLDHWRGQVA